MAATLLVLFVLLLLIAPKLAWIALAVAIALLVTKRLGPGRPSARHNIDTDTTDASI